MRTKKNTLRLSIATLIALSWSLWAITRPTTKVDSEGSAIELKSATRHNQDLEPSEVANMYFADNRDSWPNLIFTLNEEPPARVYLGEFLNKSDFELEPPEKQKPENGSTGNKSHSASEVIRERIRINVRNSRRITIAEQKELPPPNLNAHPKSPTPEVAPRHESLGPEGKLRPEYILSGSVNDLKIIQSEKNAKADPSQGEKVVAQAVMTLRISDAQTSQVLFATAELTETTLELAHLGSTYATRDELIDLESTALLSAIDSCINKGIFRLVEWFDQRSRKTRVSPAGSRRYHIGLENGQSLAFETTLDGRA